ncbi:MAG: right-handed parallel beta-helix repeat-containing protein, partial [Thermoplasmata archaeon]
TGEEFATIQAAIDDGDTLDGHTLWVGKGIYHENVVVNKTLNLIGEYKEGTIIDGSDSGTVLMILSDGVNITCFTFESSGWGGPDCAGVGVHSDHNNISGNILTQNYHNGIFLYPTAEENLISENILSGNRHGIWLNSSSYNHIVHNEIDIEHWDGISLFSGGHNNTITANTILGAGTGIYLYSSYDYTVFDNTILYADSRGIRILSSHRNNITGNNISSGSGDGIYLRYSDENDVTDNIVINNNYGIYSYSSHLNNITDNIVINNGYGIDLYSSDLNNITANNISFNNDFGLYLEDSSNNSIFHNSILDNTNQSYDNGANNYWDSGYPFGGNYWSDYGGEDKYNGPYQDIPGSDGLGDTPHVIDGDSQDNYPLMLPWEDFLKMDITPPETTHDYDGLWHTSDFTITLSAFDEISGVNETYYMLNSGPVKSLSIHGDPLISTEASNNTLEYWSIDNAGNEEPHRYIYNIKLDKTKPSTTNDYNGLWHYTDFIITLTASDATSGVNDTFYRINSGDIYSLSLNGQPAINTEGANNTLEFWSVDMAGNTEEHQLLWNIKLNKTYPDLTVSSEDISFSKPRLIDGSDAFINVSIHNIGNLSAQAQVMFYDGEPTTGSLIGSVSLEIPAGNSAPASVRWNTTLGVHRIHILIEDSLPAEPFTDNNIANVSVTVEVRPVLVLSVGDINIFRFESGEERTVPVYVSCYNNSATNVRLLVLDDKGLNISVVTPPQNLSKDQSFVFYLRIKAPVLKEKQKYVEEDILLQAVSDEVSSNEESMDVLVGREAAEFLGLFLLIGGALAVAGVVGILGGTEIGKYALFAAAMSLYTRLSRKDIMDQETRGMIRGYIMANPGEHYNAIKRALHLKNGTLAYHLKTL